MGKTSDLGVRTLGEKNSQCTDKVRFRLNLEWKLRLNFISNIVPIIATEEESILQILIIPFSLPVVIATKKAVFIERWRQWIAKGLHDSSAEEMRLGSKTAKEFGV